MHLKCMLISHAPQTTPQTTTLPTTPSTSPPTTLQTTPPLSTSPPKIQLTNKIYRQCVFTKKKHFKIKKN